MIQKIRVYQLLLLFTLALVNLIYLQLGESLPDSAYTISSNSQSIGTISYYFSSLISAVHYYTGPWLVIPFLVNAFLYAFMFSKRVATSDLFVPFILVTIFYGATYLISPSSIGNGLLIPSLKYLDLSVVGTSTFLFTVLFFYLCLKGSFLMTIRYAASFIEKLVKHCWLRLTLTTRDVINYLGSISRRKSGAQLKQRVITMLKSDSSSASKEKKKEEIIESIVSF